MNQIAIVTGGSGGIGRCTAQELRKAGCTVYEFSRREKPARGVVHLTADITDEQQARAAVAEVIRREGRPDSQFVPTSSVVKTSALWPFWPF